MLSVNGRILARHFIATLSNDNSDLNRGLESSSGPILPLVVIAAPPRSGTTFLHALLASVPNARAIRGWQCVREPMNDEASRTATRRTQRQLLERLVPELLSLHPFAVSGPEELNQLGATLGLSLVHFVLFGVDGFTETERKMGSCYQGDLVPRGMAAHGIDLHGPSTDFVVVKCPQLYALDDSAICWPGRVIHVNIVRDPESWMDSWCTLIDQVQRRVLTAPPELTRLRDSWSDIFQPGRAFDVEFDFATLLSRPVTVVQEIVRLAVGDSYSPDLSKVEELVDFARAVRPQSIV